ncbi:uncharacterized protein BKA55DRAFT_697220 [Fusarium redolens]|uniref:Uncharacterized protein n=1 Tax=Fusarium redolens TaxID=48865 RepID=A0A9P9JLI9_FUSRE|nr:uncharacterized protein BKA55DRAFT_697220 [Fusarium redolens]KAH7224383.1 hypothetical protein BKA55DRAFT_697220 [Fusarium redolens]
MRDVYEKYKDHLDVVALFADALMNWKPQKMFDVKTGKPITSSPVFEVCAILESGMAMPGGRRHAGIPHLYIHLTERSDEPEAALPACDIIRDLVPDAGHMSHMPTHIDVLVGKYRRSMAYNHKATLADDQYFAKHGAYSQRDLFREAAKRVPVSRLDYPNRIVDVLKVATAMLHGEIEYRRQNYHVAFEALREAIKAEDSLMYTEPWGWMLPARHPY